MLYYICRDDIFSLPGRVVLLTATWTVDVSGFMTLSVDDKMYLSFYWERECEVCHVYHYVN